MALDGELDIALNDVGPLVWIFREVESSLDSSRQLLRKFSREQEERLKDGSIADTTNLRAAKAQLHQAVGAVEVVGVAGAPAMLKALEGAVARCVDKPEMLSESALATIEQGMNALRDYMHSLISGRSPQPVKLFQQYALVLKIAAVERIHPADLWEFEFEWRDVSISGLQTKQDLSSGTAIFDRSLLQLLRGQSSVAAQQLLPLFVTCHAHGASGAVRTFWAIAAAMAEAVATKQLPVDDNVKRAFTRLGLQYRGLISGKADVSERLARDVLFFCSSITKREGGLWLPAVAAAYGLQRYEPVDYTRSHYGIIDPNAMKLAQRRVATLKELWAELSNGDVSRVRSVPEAADLVAESVTQIYPAALGLGDRLARLVKGCTQHADALTPDRAIEVANTVLFIEASLASGADASEFTGRATELSLRLDRSLNGQPAGVMEPWMEDLYRKSSESQTMGSVVQELKVSLANTESALDQFFRKPEDRQIIAAVPGLLAQMRGVLSVLGLDEAGHAVANARSTVEDWLLASTAPPEAQCQRLAQNVGALSFMIDLLAYQPTAARALFTFDQSTGEFKSQVKRQSRHEPEPVTPATMTDQVNLVAAQLAVGADSAAEQAQLAAQLESIKLEAAIADAPEVRAVAQDALTALSTGDHQAAAEALQSLAAATPVAEAPNQPAVAAPLPATDDDGDDELRAIFLEEGKEVSTSGLQQVAQLRQSATDPEALVTLRRAFHTLKGSSRMVGLTEFGEAAWQMEQVLNGFLAEQKPASAPLLDLSQDTLEHFSKWLHAIEQGAPQPAWVEPISASAETFKATGRYLPVASGAVAVPAIDLPKDALVGAGLETDLNFDLLPAEPQPPAAQVAETALNFSLDIDAMPAIEPLAEVAPPASIAEPTAPTLEASEVSMEMFLAAGGDAAVTAAPPAELPMAEVIVHPAAEPVLRAEEGVRQIGELAIPIPLYNIYLNESDELVRRLAAELDMWRIEGKSHVPDGAIAAAHTLGGSSATVGFRPLADLGYEMEAALIACRDHQHTPGADEHAALSAGAEEARRLLHHFAAGFHKDSEPQVRAAISALRAHWQEPPRPTANLTPALPAQNHDEIVPLAAAGLAAAAAAVAPVVTLAADVPAPGIETAPAVEAAPVEPLVPQEPAAPAFTLSAPSAPAVAVAALHDEGEMDVVDPDLFPIFEEEAQELLPNLSEALRSWVQGPADTAHPKRALRLLHTFKGSARLAGAMRLGEMAHSLESDVETVLRTEVTTATVMPLVEQCDDIVTRFEQLKRGEVHSPHEFEYHTESTPALAAPADAVVPEVDTASPVRVDGAAPSVSAFKLAAPLVNAAPTASKANQAVRVRAGLLDRLFNQAGEVSITRARLETELGSLKGSLGDLTENLARLRQQLRDIEVQAETQMQSRMESTKETIDFDPLEFDRFTRFQELTRMMAESVNDVATVQGALNRTLQVTEDDLQRQARMTKELQRDLLRTRMVEFESLSERLYRVVRQAAKELSKNVRLDIEGGQTEMDRSVLDRLGGSFEHLLRNCVAHGIELPEQRAKAGKPEVGQISIALRQEGNEVTVVFSDDGAGLNFSRIRAKAESLGMLQPGEATTDEHMAEMIFTPGFSTADQVSEISGRGIGMDVVKSEILGLGGRVTVATHPGKGTTFTLVLPLTTAVTQIVLVRMGQLTVGVPSSLVEIVQRLKPEEIEQRYRLGRHQYSNLEVDFFPLAKLLQASLGTIGEGRTNPVLVVRSAAQRVAVHVDEILGNQEVVVRNLGPQLSRVPGLAGMSVLASGAVVLIYNPVALASVYGPSLRAAQEAAAVAAAEGAVAAGADGAGAAAVVADTPLRREPTVMITDDSLTVRRVAQRLMQRNGYRVLLAKDGLDALEVLQTETPDVMLLDIEMPRMDGFDLMRNLRSAGAEKKLRELPVIMITSRIADKHRQLATELGVNHYLGKPYNEEELLSLVSRYTKVQVPEQA